MSPTRSGSRSWRLWLRHARHRTGCRPRRRHGRQLASRRSAKPTRRAIRGLIGQQRFCSRSKLCQSSVSARCAPDRVSSGYDASSDGSLPRPFACTARSRLRRRRLRLTTAREALVASPPRRRQRGRFWHEGPTRHPLVGLADPARSEEHYVGQQASVWLFPNNDGTEPVVHWTFSRVWERARRVSGREDLRFHDLSHSGLTWFAQAGATQADLMHQAGPASPAAASGGFRASALSPSLALPKVSSK